MNQPQRMAPVGTDKELSDLLDFSMVSWAHLPGLPPCRGVGLRPRSLGQDACHKGPPSWEPGLRLGLEGALGGGGGHGLRACGGLGLLTWRVGASGVSRLACVQKKEKGKRHPARR